MDRFGSIGRFSNHETQAYVRFVLVRCRCGGSWTPGVGSSLLWPPNRALASPILSPPFSLSPADPPLTAFLQPLTSDVNPRYCRKNEVFWLSLLQILVRFSTVLGLLGCHLN